MLSFFSITYLFPLMLICLRHFSRLGVRVRVQLLQLFVRLVKASQFAPLLQLLLHCPVELIVQGHIVERAAWEVVPVRQGWALVSQRKHSTPALRRSIRLLVIVCLTALLRRPEGRHILHQTKNTKMKYIYTQIYFVYYIIILDAPNIVMSLILKATLTLCLSTLDIMLRSVVSEIPPWTISTLWSITVARGRQLKIFWRSFRIFLPCNCRPLIQSWLPSATVIDVFWSSGAQWH